MMNEDRLAVLEARIEALEATAHLPKYMDAQQVCDLVGIRRTKFQQMRADGTAPPALFFGTRSMRFDRDDVMKWAEQFKEAV